MAQTSSYETVIPPSATKLRGLAPLTCEIGDYQLLEEIGRGGMGVVFKARQKSLNRIVALKLILAGEFASETTVARFREEAELVARLQHPNIVPIYEIGESGGWHFYSMKLIEGGMLADMISWESKQPQPKERRETRGRDAQEAKPDSEEMVQIDPRPFIELMVKVCRATHFAHQSGIIHRDLSPENILVDGEQNPWVTDFGMARFLNADRRLTVTRGIVGKPDYMSPEQADPRAGHLTTASDIFSLGAILYHACTGHRPFAAETLLAALDRIRYETPVSPRALNRKINRDLETIIVKSLAKESSARYASAAALADDLDHWLTGEPILARSPPLLERTFKWIQRKPLKAAFLGAIASALLGPLVTTFYLYHFVLPKQARSHPTIGRDQNIGGWSLTFETGRVDRATLNFDPLSFREHSRPAVLYFTNIPREHLTWVSNLSCQVFADIPGAPDPPRSPPVRHGQTFLIERHGPRDRAYYISPMGWQGQDVLSRAPDARLCITLLDPEKEVKMKDDRIGAPQ